MIRLAPAAPFLLLTLLLTSSTRSPTAPGQEPAEHGETTREHELRRLDSWPSLNKPLRAAVIKDVERLRKARTEEMAEQARSALTAVGAGVVPLLLPKLGKERDEAARRRIREVLDAITGAAHTRLLTRFFTDRSAAIRIWSMRRAASFPDPGIRAPALAAWRRVAALAKKGEAESAELDAAALAVTSSGSLEGLDHLCARAEKAWRKLGGAIRSATEAVRGPEATDRLLNLLEGASEGRTVACLRLLAGCGDPATAPPRLRSFLDTEDSRIRIAVINALRGILDGEGPIEKLSVFDAIGLSNEWKRRIR